MGLTWMTRCVASSELLSELTIDNSEPDARDPAKTDSKLDAEVNRQRSAASNRQRPSEFGEVLATSVWLFCPWLIRPLSLDYSLR